MFVYFGHVGRYGIAWRLKRLKDRALFEVFLLLFHEVSLHEKFTFFILTRWSHISIQSFNRVFPRSLISWYGDMKLFSSLPNLTLSDFLLRDLRKPKNTRKCLATILELKQHIHVTIEEFSWKILR